MKQQFYAADVVDNYVLIETDEIKGDLDCILVKTSSKFHIRIASKLGYIIYDSKELEGFEYIAPRIQPRDQKGDRINFQAEKYKLNEPLIITMVRKIAKGENEVEVTIRYD